VNKVTFCLEFLIIAPQGREQGYILSWITCRLGRNLYHPIPLQIPPTDRRTPRNGRLESRPLPLAIQQRAVWTVLPRDLAKRTARTESEKTCLSDGKSSTQELSNNQKKSINILSSTIQFSNIHCNICTLIVHTKNLCIVINKSCNFCLRSNNKFPAPHAIWDLSKPSWA